MSKDKRTTTLARMLHKIEKIDLTCEEIRERIAKLRASLGEPDEVCPDEVASEKALKGIIEEMVYVNMAEQNKDKGEA
jgi:hypothetical protein